MLLVGGKFDVGVGEQLVFGDVPIRGLDGLLSFIRCTGKWAELYTFDEFDIGMFIMGIGPPIDGFDLNAEAIFTVKLIAGKPGGGTAAN